MLTILLLACCTPLVEPKHEPNYGERPIAGAFVYVEGLEESPGVTVTNLKRLGLCTVIFRADEPAANDTYDKMVPYVTAAHDAGLTVYVGLNYGNFPYDAQPGDYRAMAEQDRATAARFRNVEFDGWYLAREIYNFADHRPIREHYIDVLFTKLKNDGLLRKHVLISPYFNPARDRKIEQQPLLGPAETAEMFYRLFAGSGITAVALQDHVGARRDPQSMICHRWSEKRFIPVAALYEEEFVQKFSQEGAPDAWINVESFEWKKKPARWKRLRRQLRIVPTATKKIVTWDYAALLKTEYQKQMKPNACP